MAEELDDDGLLDAYAPADNTADSPATVAARVLRLEEHAHLVENEVQFLWLMRRTPHLQAGRQVLAMVHEPQVQGRLRELFEHMLVKTYGFMPHFVVTVDAEWWSEATDLQRQALVHHELMHVRQAVDREGNPRFNKATGEAVLCLVSHDIEEFNKTVERYGAWKADVAQFAETVNRHG